MVDDRVGVKVGHRHVCVAEGHQHEGYVGGACRFGVGFAVSYQNRAIGVASEFANGLEQVSGIGLAEGSGICAEHHREKITQFEFVEQLERKMFGLVGADADFVSPFGELAHLLLHVVEWSAGNGDVCFVIDEEMLDEVGHVVRVEGNVVPAQCVLDEGARAAADHVTHFVERNWWEALAH